MVPFVKIILEEPWGRFKYRVAAEQMVWRCTEALRGYEKIISCTYHGKLDKLPFWSESQTKSKETCAILEMAAYPHH
jgi:hypothetical protein